MSRPAFIDFWAYKWSDLLRVNRGTLKDKGMWAYYSYIHDAVRDNKGWDVMAREILTARGNTFLDGPANYFRTALKPEELAENITQGFMGIRVQCAKCHNHPLEKWTQNEYYGMANLFARVKFKADLGIYVNDEMTVYNAPSGDVIQPRLGKPVPPKPLGGPMLALDAPEERRAFFAKWLTRPDNWYFSHSLVNRVWAHFMGRGLVEPVDDLRETNPATNPELFDALAADFVKHKFDLQHLIRQIVTSRTYQLSSASTPQNSKDDRYFSHFMVRRMTAEELLDALSQVSGQSGRVSQHAARTSRRAVARYARQIRLYGRAGPSRPRDYVRVRAQPGTQHGAGAPVHQRRPAQPQSDGGHRTGEPPAQSRQKRRRHSQRIVLDNLRAFSLRRPERSLPTCKPLCERVIASAPKDNTARRHALRGYAVGAGEQQRVPV